MFSFCFRSNSLKSILQSSPVFSNNCRSRLTIKEVRKMDSNTKVQQKFDFFLILDFEATCDSPTQIKPVEVIEFPVLLLNGKTFQIDSVFHSYVKPVINPQLTPFCTKLTGILQEQVDNGPTFDQALRLFDKWLQVEAKLVDESGNKLKPFTFVTYGNWDLQIMLPAQCSLSGHPVPSYAKSWINLKKSVAEVTRVWPNGLLRMLELLNLSHEGRLHSGIDDCKNIANGLKELARSGYVLKETSN